MSSPSKKEVVIVGSGIAGTTIAYLLTQRGHRVTMLEVGPDYPYPHTQQFSDEILHQYRDPAYAIADDVRKLEATGVLENSVVWKNLVYEQIMVVGGMATRWSAWTPRFLPYNFHTRSTAGYGVDWPISYQQLEPYYCRAEELIGVSGTDEDNPFAPPRSKPYPLPQFEHGYEDLKIADRLKAGGIHTHTVPQARTRTDYHGRPGCKNFNVCGVCPIGARYSPQFHLNLAKATGLLTLHADTAVRQILVERSGHATGVLAYPGNRGDPVELGASTVVVAAGALETARLMLLSARAGHGRTLNESGQVGKNLLFNHIWGGHFTFKDAFYGGRLGARTLQSYQFIDPPNRRRHGGAKLDFVADMGAFERDINGRGGSVWVKGPSPIQRDWRSGAEATETIGDRLKHARKMGVHCEVVPYEKTFVDLSPTAVDRFGAPIAHVHIEPSPFEEEGRLFAKSIFEQVALNTDPSESQWDDTWFTGHHHLGTARMGRSAKDSVVDSLGRVHGVPNVYLAGGSIFAGSSAVNPTLTIVALAIRTADHLIEQLQSAR